MVFSISCNYCLTIFEYELNGVSDHGGNNDPKARAAGIIGALDVTGERKLNKQEFIAGYVL